MSYGTVVIGDTEYETVIPFEAYYDGSSETVSYTSEEAKRVVILCEHCRNFRLEPIVLTSIEELVQLGWIKEKT
jgi:hypothetical protein